MTIPMRKQSSRRAVGITLLAAACIGLAVISAMLPVLLQSRALARTEAAIAALQPTLRQIEALRQRRAVYREGARLLAEESRRVGDTLSILAAISQALPDNCYLTNLALQARHLTLSGRSPSAAHLITVLAADPAIRDPAFAAPVLRGDGPSGDVFLIKASVAP